MFGSTKRPEFQRVGKAEVSLTMLRIRTWDDGGYGLSMSYYTDGEVEGGHSATIWGEADLHWRNNEEVREPKYRMNIKIETDLSRREMEPGILGGGRYYDEYVDVSLNLEPKQVRDIVYELRLSSARQVHIGGHEISPIIFRVTSFGMSEPRDGEPVLYPE
jgi:hypothetical protein